MCDDERELRVMISMYRHARSEHHGNFIARHQNMPAHHLSMDGSSAMDAGVMGG